MDQTPFHLEQYFDEREFSYPFQLGCSDCEPISVCELLQLDPTAEEQFKRLDLGYIEPSGSNRLRCLIASLYSSLNETGVLVTTGAEEAIFVLFEALFHPGDHLIVQFPTYQSLYQIAADMPCDISFWRMEETVDGEWTVDVDCLKGLLKPNTKAIVVNTPNNPTGAMIDSKTWSEIAEIVTTRGIYLISDEAYRFSERSGFKTTPGADLPYERSVSIGVLSKVFGVPGLRVGWLATSDAELLRKSKNRKYYTTVCSSAPSDFLACITLEHKEELLLRCREIIERNVSCLESFMNRQGDRFSWSIPQGGTTAFPRISGIRSDEFCQRLLDEKGVVLVPSTLFDYGNEHIRIGLGRRDMPDCLLEVERFLESGVTEADRI